MRCPNCGAVTPRYATACDCGHEMQSGPETSGWDNMSDESKGCVTLILVFCAVIFLMWVGGCFVSRSDPVQRLARELSHFPQYFVLVDNVSDGFFRNQLTLEGRFKKEDPDPNTKGEGDKPGFEQRKVTYTVSDSMVRRYERYVGMVVASKESGGKVVTDYRQAQPPGYSYVGNRHYGYWHSGGYWAWYGQYRFFGSMLGGHRIYQNDYRNYSSYRSRGQAYYGPTNSGRQTFGATGTATQKSRPAFYSKYKSKQQSFKSSARSRAGRTSRGGGYFSGFGK